ncbi:NAD(P)-dependent oxidoreductase [Actinorhabdospora filicis]|uniref:NAD(P)-dependent oxidoreductase n=1 Tax=Actinorhabdospora filicis TaxID=1785913 RepID=A0A9W6SP23_9ACTN|nr:NAD(P)H-binding protein [Actinorhabdospora filicis]GLZ79277.1 NAD(P)-dependent oxidoreductase [Actinorhabdospora filicis]
MKIMVTGATGRLGSLIAARLLDAGVDPGELVLGVRDPAKLSWTHGGEVRHADYDRPETLDTAFTGVGKLLLMSANGTHTERAGQHARAIDAAARAGVAHIVYTGILSTAPEIIGRPAWDTEIALAASGVPTTVLRHALYTQNYATDLPEALADGELLTATGDGRLASADRRDLARAAAAVLTGTGHEGRAYELTGPRAWSLDEMCATAASTAGRPLTHRSVSVPELRRVFADLGVPPHGIDVISGIQAGIRDGLFSTVTPDLENLLGGPATPMEETVRDALAV